MQSIFSKVGPVKPPAEFDTPFTQDESVFDPDGEDSLFFEDDSVNASSLRENSVVKNAPKRMRLSGGRAAVQKKVTADLDSDDEIIYHMKTQGYSDNAIAKRLVDEDRINYDVKTISSRWSRIRAAKQKAQDEMFDQQLDDWHEGDDERLIDAIQKAEDQMVRHLSFLNEKRWRLIAENLRRSNNESHYSPRACKERYHALINGTATIPIELDDDPEARQEEIAKNRAEKAILNEEAARVLQAKREREEREAKQVKLAREAKRDIRDARRKAKEERKAAHRVVKKQERDARRAARKLIKQAAAAKAQAQRAGCKAKKVAKKNLAAGRRKSYTLQQELNESEEKIKEIRDLLKAAQIAFAPKKSTEATEDNDTPTPNERSVRAQKAAAARAKAMRDDPRTILTRAELLELWKLRGQKIKKEVKYEEVLVQLGEYDAKMALPKLRAVLRVYKGVMLGGSKAELLERLAYTEQELMVKLRLATSAHNEIEADMETVEKENENSLLAAGFSDISEFILDVNGGALDEDMEAQDDIEEEEEDDSHMIEDEDAGMEDDEDDDDEDEEDIDGTSMVDTDGASEVIYDPRLPTVFHGAFMTSTDATPDWIRPSKPRRAKSVALRASSSN